MDAVTGNASGGQGKLSIMEGDHSDLLSILSPFIHDNLSFE